VNEAGTVVAASAAAAADAAAADTAAAAAAAAAAVAAAAAAVQQEIDACGYNGREQHLRTVQKVGVCNSHKPQGASALRHHATPGGSICPAALEWNIEITYDPTLLLPAAGQQQLLFQDIEIELRRSQLVNCALFTVQVVPTRADEVLECSRRRVVCTV
jgi:hypothetical protein